MDYLLIQCGSLLLIALAAEMLGRSVKLWYVRRRIESGRRRRTNRWPIRKETESDLHGVVLNDGSCPRVPVKLNDGRLVTAKAGSRDIWISMHRGLKVSLRKTGDRYYIDKIM